jgi:hypothetical protein
VFSARLPGAAAIAARHADKGFFNAASGQHRRSVPALQAHQVDIVEKLLGNNVTTAASARLEVDHRLSPTSRFQFGSPVDFEG